MRRRKSIIVGLALTLILNNSRLSQVKVTKFLGVIIDENLTWKNHIDELATKISKNIGIMNRLKHYLPSKILLTLYNSFVSPYLNYSILTWGNSPTKCNKLLILQKRAVRIISNADYRDHSAPLFAKFNILQCNDLYFLNLGKFMYKSMHNLLPSCFNSCFTLASNMHVYSTRSSARGNLFVQFNRTSMSKNSVIYQGTLYWNSLADSLKSLPSLSVFAKNLKSHFLASYS